ncbi:hydantoinase B/oxoprolinase family protein [Actinomadura madurae]|uniref:N-methylhydantoinase B n=1 Tax=Actinomadura madurae TaxID=1993 RepID=A0A1I4ZVW0_9ACTN|nr:hydantoinase B/oxoprolinase family protein [Actinomadura madurae]SFN54223.1 N-methylhydantoinase B [Actinomadura madurae]SPT56838.1 Acetone carboxylase alpha subunit [Actinomadura madurae]
MTSTIPGADEFTSRPLPRAELLRQISPALPLHDVDDDRADRVDALTYEVVRHRLWAITQEMGETLRRMSGSHVVTESNDFNFSICDELGEQVQVGTYNIGLIGSMDLAITWTLRNRGDNPGIGEGDMFLCNDPWIGGGLHQNDAAILAPIFHDGRLFGWTTAIAHQVDLGGPRPGSFSPSARDVFGEALPTPPMKVVRDGVLQRDVADAWVRRSRLPHLVGLDLRAKIAANKNAAEQILRLIAKYGADTVKIVMRRMMDDAERRLRAKLATLPDGTWTAVGYQEQSRTGDRDLHPIKVAMTKEDDRLVFDFRGTAGQTGVINCPYPGLRAGIVFTMLPLLAGDIPWAAGGLMRCFEIVTDEDTITNASFPAAVGKGPFGPAWGSGNLVAEVLAKMLDAEPGHRGDVQSICNGTTDLCVVSGVDVRGGGSKGFVSPVFDVMAGGYGAQVYHDGVDTGGRLIIPSARAPDVEMTEYLYPLVALWRREQTDSGGPGRQRGGMSGSVCYVQHPDQKGTMHLVVSGTGKVANQNVGLAGGYPGNSQLDLVVRGIDVPQLAGASAIPADLDELGGESEVLPCEGESAFDPGDALYLHWQAGGGYGDPLLRPAGNVRDDVRQARVSAAAARDVYGVVFREDGEVDVTATDEARRKIRHRRASGAGLPGAEPEPIGTLDLAGMRRLDDNLAVLETAEGGVVVCVHCGTRIGPLARGAFVAALARRDAHPTEAGPHIWHDPSEYVDAEVVFRQLFCPGCLTAVNSRVVPADHPLPQDEYRNWA